MNLRLRIVYAAVGMFFASIELFQPSISLGQAQGSTPTFRASTHLVLLDVVVTDKAGQPVPGLRAEDFEVKEDGKPQKIAFLTAPENNVPQRGLPTLPTGVYSNEAVYRLPGTVPTVIVLDAVNTPSKDQFYARHEMLKYLKQQYKPGQPIAVFTLTDKLSMVQDFTGDPAILRTCLEKIDPSQSTVSALASGAEPPLDASRLHSQAYLDLSSAFERFQKSQIQYVTDRRAELTLDAMRQIIRILGGLPGRKNVIWLTAGFPFTLDPDGYSIGSDWQDLARREGGGQSASPIDTGSLTGSERPLYSTRIREVSAQMASAQIAIYPLDVRGLMTGGGINSMDRQQSMLEIARETGGRAFVNRNDIDNGLALSQRDRGATYSLGYYPANQKWDNRKLRRIDVKLNRSGLETNYRRGYFTTDVTKPTQEKLDQVLAEAWRDGAPDTLVSFDAKVAPSENGKARVEFLVDANSVSVGEDPNGKKFDVAFYVAAYSADGKILGLQATKLDRVFPLEVYQKLLQERMKLHVDTAIPAGTSEFRLAVRDNQTGYIGTLIAAIPAK